MHRLLGLSLISHIHVIRPVTYIHLRPSPDCIFLHGTIRSTAVICDSNATEEIVLWCRITHKSEQCTSFITFIMPLIAIQWLQLDVQNKFLQYTHTHCLVLSLVPYHTLTVTVICLYLNTTHTLIWSQLKSLLWTSGLQLARGLNLAHQTVKMWFLFHFIWVSDHQGVCSEQFFLSDKNSCLIKSSALLSLPLFLQPLDRNQFPEVR